MHKFIVTRPDDDHYTVEVSTDHTADLFMLTNAEAFDLLECVKAVLNGTICEHDSVHRIEIGLNTYNVLFSVSERYVKSYAVSKRKLIEFKMNLMGALNG